MDMNIRSLEASDVGVCANILATSPPWDRYGITESSARKMLHSIHEDPMQLVRVAVVGDQLAGFVCFILRGAFYHSGYVRLLGVVHTFRRMGIGRSLLSAAEDELGQQVKSVTLLVSDFNHSAQRFYHSQGYVKVGALPDYIVPRITEFVYFKRLVQR